MTTLTPWRQRELRRCRALLRQAEREISFMLEAGPRSALDREIRCTNVRGRYLGEATLIIERSRRAFKKEREAA